MVKKVTNHIFLITGDDVIVVGDQLNELLYKKYNNELEVKDIIIDPHMQKPELEIAKIIAELFKEQPKKAYAKVLYRLYKSGVFVYADEFLSKILENWHTLKFKDLVIKHKNPYNTITLETHIKHLL